VTGSINQAVKAAAGLVRAELKLAQAEAKIAARSFGKHASSIGVFAILAFFGLAALTAALIFGIGALLGGTYGWASLIVAVLFLGVAGIAVASTVRKIKNEDLTFPHLRRSLRAEQQAVNHKLREVAEAAPSLKNFRRKDAA
jgi:uncharacterized membrane protein YqjE